MYKCGGGLGLILPSLRINLGACPASHFDTINTVLATSIVCFLFWFCLSLPPPSSTEYARQPTHGPDDHALRRHTHLIPPQYLP